MQVKLGAAFTAAGLAALLLTGCGPQPQTNAQGADASAASCPDDGPRLAGTGFCQGRAAALLKVDPEARSPELPDCAWVVNEVMLPGEEALLYRAAVCSGVTTTFDFAGGAHSGELAYAQSALFGESGKGRAPVRLFGSEPNDPRGALKGAIAEAPDGAAMACEIRAAGLEGWPTDALLLAPSAAVRAKLPQDEPIAACGPYGVDENSVRYWRVGQGYAWFFDLGQEQPDFDPTSFTVLVKGADGAWTVKE